jgi:serine protease Do
MLWRYTYLPISLLTFLAIPFVCLASQDSGEDLESLQEKAMKAAAAKVAPCVVQIETSGGTDVIGSGLGSPQVRKGTGPTTGLIVAADGYVISSAFNFANKPSAIFVAVPGHKDRLVAKVVATDHTRMLTLLKIEANGLPVPAAAPKKDIRVGQWSLALGRTWAGLDTPPSVSIGVISALGRIWGKAIQTDAKVSPVNYGGPLVDLQGRVMGILVPASPRGQDDTAGVEWYDSGIGFAIPLEDVNKVLLKLREGKDLHRGLLGVNVQNPDMYGSPPVITTVAPDSAALRAGIKSGDTITEIDGVPIVRYAQFLHVLGPKYEGDPISVKVQRGKEALAFPNLKLTGTLSAFIQPFLGVLPMRDDPELGEEIRYVYPKSPAEAAGLKVGDRIMRVGFGTARPQAFSGRDELSRVLDHLLPGTELTLQVNRKEAKKTETLKVTLGLVPESVPEQLPEAATHKKALAPRKGARPTAPPPPPSKEDKEGGKPADKEEKKKPEVGLLKRTTPARDHDYWLYVPEDYNANISYALVVWLHPAGKDKDKATEKVVSAWEDFCSENHIILLCPRAESDNGWLGSDADFVQEEIRAVMAEYTVDRQRVIAHGMGIGGQMAFYLGFNARDLIRGVATTGAILNNQPKDNVANQRLAFFIVAGGKDPLLDGIVQSKDKLIEHKFPVIYREVPEGGSQYLDGVMLRELVRWIDSLDQQ